MRLWQAVNNILSNNLYRALKKTNLFQPLLELHIKISRFFPLPLISLPDGNRFMIGFGLLREIYGRGVYDKFFTPSKGDIVVDLGATFGIYSLRASRKVGSKGFVIAVEPHPQNFDILKNHLKINKVKNVKPIRVAIGNKVQKANLFLDNHPVSHSTRPTPNEGFIQVQMVTLDWLIEELDLLNVDVAKIDVEGEEVNVLKGMKNIFPDKIVLETAEMGKKKKCKRILESRGYDIEVDESFFDVYYLYATKK